VRNITLHLTHFPRPKESGVGVEVANVELTVGRFVGHSGGGNDEHLSVTEIS
jgi:hypothetical protein